MEKAEVEKKIVECLEDYKNHYDNYAINYQDYAEKVHSMIHGNIDWGNKAEHNAKIHLNKLGIALDSWKATVKRGLMNFDDWMKVLVEPHMQSKYMNEFEAKRMIDLLLRDEDPKVKLSDCLGLAFVENLATLKVTTCVKEIKGPGGKTYKSPRTELVPLDIWDHGMDPDCVDLEKDTPLYRFHKIEMPKHEVLKYASDEGTPDQPYIKERVKMLKGLQDPQKDEQDFAKGKQTLMSSLGRKVMLTLYEFHGTLLDNDGNVIEYDGMPLEGVRVTLSEGMVIDKPVPLEKLTSGFVSHRILRHNKDILGRARGHAGYEINHILDEYASAMADAGIKSASNMTVYKPDMLLDPEEAADGFTYDSNVAIIGDANPNDIIHTVRLGELPSTMFNVYNILEQNFTENLATNSTAMSGALPGKQVRATEVAAANQTVGQLEESVLMDIDDCMIEKLILMIFHQGLKLAKKFSDLDLEYIFSGDANRIAEFKDLRSKKSKLFEELGYTFRFKGHGLRGLANQAKTGQLVMNLLTSALGNPMMLEILERSDFDLSKMFGMGVKGMGVDPETLKDKKVGEMARERQNYRELGRGLADVNGTGGNRPQRGAVAGNQSVTQDTEPGNNGAY